MDDSLNLETLWDNLLSRQQDRIRAAFASLTKQEREAVVLHLKQMAVDAGWHIEQQKSAITALIVLEENIE